MTKPIPPLRNDFDRDTAIRDLYFALAEAGGVDMATLTSMMAGKADSSHTHTIAEVSGLATALAANAPSSTTIYKTSQTSRTGTTTIAADPHLTFNMAANKSYYVKLVALFLTTANADFRFRHAGPTSPAAVHLTRHWIVNGGTAFAGIAIDTAYSAADVAVVGTGLAGVVVLEGLIANGANAGAFEFRWAQNTSDAGATIVRQGSYLTFREL